MRIISQNGKVDLPYENIIITIEEGTVITAIPSCGGSIYMGTYSTPKKAMTVMEELRKKYEDVGQWSCAGDHPRVFQFPPDEEATQ